jgi:pimeloyl-ACP methyl ester carboxylesterase
MFALPLLLLVIVFAAARCYPANTRVIVFVQGLYTTYDESGTQETVVEGQRFNVLKNGFLARGYPRSSLLDFSYNGGAVTSSGAWQPSPYACEDTDRRATDNLVPLEQMLRDYRSRHKDAHFALVGHSLGGYVSFLEGAREAARSEADKLGVDVIVTVDAPLKGVSPDKKTLIDIIPCDKTYIAGAEIVAQKFDAATATLRADQASMMSRQGIRLATLGNDWDCLWNTGHCLPGGTWVDDRDTQFLPGAAAVSTAYQVDAAPLLSHDAILADPAAVHDAVTFVGAP